MSHKELMDVAHKVEERNWAMEKDQEEKLSMQLKTFSALKWSVLKPNFSRVSSLVDLSEPTTTVSTQSPVQM